MMRHVPLLCLLCFFAQPALQDSNADLDDVIEEIMYLMSSEVDDVSPDNKYDYDQDPDLFVPPSTTCQQSMEMDSVKDVNGLYEYNPFKVWEARTEAFQNERSVMNGAALTNSFLQAVAQSTGNDLNYHITLGDSSASMMFYDVTFPSPVEMYPALFSINVASDFCGSATTDDSLVDVQYIIASKKHSCPDPEVQVTKEMFLNIADNSSACRAFEGSTCDCYEPDIVTSTSGFTETGQYGKPRVQRPDVTMELWYPKLPSYYKMLMEMYASYDIIVSQIHQSLEAISAAPFCCFNDIWYQYGDVIMVPDNPCLYCVCSEHWTGIGNCSVLTCPLDDYVNKTGDTSIDVIAVPGSCCGVTKSIVIGDFCIGNTACAPGGSCIPGEGTFSCNCFPGFQQTIGGQGCEDIDECGDPSFCVNGVCTNGNGDFTCVCNDGFTRSVSRRQGGDVAPVVCIDINECTDGTDTSSCESTSGSCTNNVGAPWTCTCLPGFTNPPGNPQTCTDVNECTDGTDTSSCESMNGTCANIVGAPWTCTCPPGYSNPPGDPQTCTDVDECSDPALCPNGMCVDIPGSYRCSCDTGFMNNGSKSCIDIDECDDPSVCTNGTCMNTIGSYVCNCDPGFTPGGPGGCMDINECDDPSVCTNGTCVNTIGSYICNCDPGFTPGGPVGCMDINECDDSSVCTNGTCVNTIGSYICNCDPGFTPGGPVGCMDIDECTTGDSAPCSIGTGTCVNTAGSWYCNCSTGFNNPTGDNTQCLDHDDCNDPSIDTTSCVDGTGVCKNNVGSSWTCECAPGFQSRPGDDQACEDIDECSDPSFCVNGECDNTAGDFNCTCNTGYAPAVVAKRQNPPPVVCVDINECANSPGMCVPNGKCVNTDGSYFCDCDAFFEPVNDECIDVNECNDETDTSSCESNGGSCTNNVGAPWTCTCPTGFINPPGDPQTCIDVNECTDGTNTSSCESNGGNCTNNVGAPWTCICPPGFINPPDDPQTCIDIDECLDPSFCVNGVCVNTPGDFICTCNSGYAPGSRVIRQDPPPFVCEDINECEINPGMCVPNGQCVNTNGSYYCDCDEFFVPVNDSCIPLDMCVDPIARCTDAALCIDGPEDLYVCQCPENKIWDESLRQCIDDPVSDPVIIRRVFTGENDTEMFYLRNNTIIDLEINVTGCFMYFEISFPGLDLTHWHSNTNSCLVKGTVEQTPYISVADDYWDPVNDRRYCKELNKTIISYFNVIRIRSASAGQSKLEFPVLVKAYKGEGACCGGILTPVSEDMNPFNQIEITSANYPLPYDNNQWCSWVVTRPPGTTDGSVVIFIIDWTVVVTVPLADEENLNCFEEDSLYLSNTKSMVDHIAKCGSFPEWGNFYTPEQAFIHWQTNEERVTRGFQIMYYFTNNIYGITTFERSLTSVCGLVFNQRRNRRDEDEVDEEEDLEDNEQPAIHVPLGMGFPKRVKRVSSLSTNQASPQELPFLVVVIIVAPKTSWPVIKHFYGVLIAENFVVTTTQVKDYQQEDKKNRKIKMNFGAYDLNTMNTDAFVETRSALKVYRNPECDDALPGVHPAVPGKTSWEYTTSVCGGCPMLMVTGDLPYNNYIQPACFPWYTFPWRSNDKRILKDAKRLFHVGYSSDETGKDTLSGVSNVPKKVSMQKTSDVNCLTPLGIETMAPQVLCALSTGGKGATQGDIGGAVLKRMYTDNPAFNPNDEAIERHWVVIGVLIKAEIGSTMPNDGTRKTTYQAYIEINAYLEWMQFAMEERNLINSKRPLTAVGQNSGPE